MRKPKRGLDVINVASAYGRDKPQIRTMLNGTPLYWNIEKRRKFANSFGLQLPAETYSQTAFSNKGFKTETDLTSFDDKDTKSLDNTKNKEAFSKSNYKDI